jgi:hypothetical protein
MSKYFLVSVANAIGRDPETGAGLFYGTTNASTAVNLSMSEEEIRGGINNVIQGIYYHDKTLECTIDKVTFSRAFLPLNVGSDILTGHNVKVLQTECLTLDGNGNGGVSKLPIGDVNVFLDEDTVMTVSAGAIQDEKYPISVPSMAGQLVTAIYEAYENVDVLTIETTTPPKVIDLTLLIQLRDENMNLAYTLQFNIPKFQVSGNYEMSLSADGTSNESLTGKALNVKAEDCNTGDMYATIKWVPVAATARNISGIIITNGNINASAGQAATFQLNVIGIYGSIDNRDVITNECTFAIAPELTGVTVDGGTVVIANTVAAGSGVITATYGDFSDSITLTIA